MHICVFVQGLRILSTSEEWIHPVGHSLAGQVVPCAEVLHAELHVPALAGVADESRIARTRVLKLMPLTQLSPEILRCALVGTLAPSITLDDLLRAASHLDWSRQAQSLGIELTPDLAAAG